MRFDQLPEHSIKELTDIILDLFKDSDAFGPYYSIRLNTGLRIHFVEDRMAGRKAVRVNISIKHNTIGVKTYDLKTQRFHKKTNIIRCTSFNHLIEEFKIVLDDLLNYAI